MRLLAFSAAVILLGCSVQTEGTGPGIEADASVGGGGVGGNVGDSGWTGGSGGTPSGGAAGATGGAAGATGGAAGAAGATGGAAGSVGTEDCTNGKDDNKDGKTDCEDPECGAFQCAPSAPGGWTGPVAFAQASAEPAACGGSYPNEALTGGQLAIAPGTCPSCACDTASVTCSSPTVRSYNDDNCGGSELANSTTGGCHGFSSSSTQNSFHLQLGSTGNSCTPQTTGSANFPVPAYSSRARVCDGEPAGAGCAGGTKCLPKPAAPYAVCIYRKDPHACPSEYPNSNEITTAFTDKRSCSDCKCDKPVCGANATATDSNACTGPSLGTATQDDQCVNLTDNQFIMGMNVTEQVSCNPVPSAAQGSVDQTIYTVCCL
ncbi:MAG: hypothetical protein KC776_11185 [Myxococcales bacterium]|nr:hypothetical protein [Myxococcales bacterium]MCB9578759.1 hypothetical protein [Polyangiaceae bacterium]